MKKLSKNNTYKITIKDIKNRVYEAQYQALKRVNSELVLMYWDIGKIISERQKQENWGDSVVEKIAKELRAEFQGKGDFSRRNVFRMRQFYLLYKRNIKVVQLVPQIGWGHHIRIMMCNDLLEKEYYIRASIAGGWSRIWLEGRIKNNDYQNWAISQTNFDKTVSKSIIAKAKNLIKDEVDLSMLGLKEDHKESTLEYSIVKNISSFLTEMGGDFAFIGRQHVVELRNKEYKIDLLFYHRSLNCLVAIELKTGEFKPEYIGKLNAYLAALDKYEKKEDENYSIGILICSSKDREEVELSLQFIAKPIGVTSYRTYNKEELPQSIEKYMPSVEDIQKRLIMFDKGK